MRVNYLGLEAFVAVAELGSFSRAAARLNLSQTALSHRLRKIEQELGVRLLARTSREVSLTETGQRILPQVRAQLTALDEMVGQLQDSARQSRRRVTFASVPTIAQYYLPQVMAEFTRAHPDIDLILRDRPANELVEKVRSGEVEFGITMLGASAWDLDAEPLMVEPYHLLVSRNHPLASRASVRVAELAGEVMVRIRTHSINRELVDVALAPVHDQIRWRYEVLNAATALSLVAAGAAVTVLPRLTARQGGDAVVGLPFADAEISRQVGVVSRRGVPMSAAGRHLLSLLRARLDAEAPWPQPRA